MTKNILILAALAAALACSACTYTDSPEATLASAYTAIQKGKLADFRETLAKPARDTLGTAQGLQSLQKALAGLQVMTGAKQLVSRVEHIWTHITYTYQVDILARAVGTQAYSHFMTATIVCEWYRQLPPPGHERAVDRDIETEDCLITNLANTR